MKRIEAAFPVSQDQWRWLQLLMLLALAQQPFMRSRESTSCIQALHPLIGNDRKAGI
jgi:hypothetical protein